MMKGNNKTIIFFNVERQWCKGREMLHARTDSSNLLSLDRLFFLTDFSFDCFKRFSLCIQCTTHTCSLSLSLSE